MGSQNFRQLVIARDFPVRRSELTCPGHSLKMMTKAAASDADEVIFDLEDACAVSQKIAARKTVVEALRTLDFKGKLRAFRPNNVKSRFFYGDVIEVVEQAGGYLDAMVLPKVDTADEVKFADRLLTQIEENVGLEIGRIKLEVLIESAKGLLRAEEIASCSPRMASLIFGIADFAGDMGMRDFTRDPARFHHAKSHIVAAARAAGIAAIDHVTVQFRDLEQVKRDAEEGAALGFDGKWAIHPTHVPVIHAAYTPTAEELKRALALLKAYRDADVEQGAGAIVFEDEMVDAASLRVEWKKLSIARKAGLVDDDFELVTPEPA